MTRFAAAPLTLLVLVLGLAACGGGGGGDAPSQEEFAKSADQICSDAEKSLQELGKATSADEVANQLDKVIDETQGSVDKLKDLDRPDGDAGKAAEKFVNALQSDIEDKGIPALEHLRDAIKDKDQAAAQKAYQELQAIETSDSNKLAKAIGANGCSD
jgi:hypothetical protein